MSSKSKLKGASYEAKIRDILTDKLKKDFKRVPLSGSLEWLKGDIFTLDGFDYIIECKHYADLEWNNFLTARTTDILEFWRQAEDQALKMKRKPLLIFRWNRSKDFAAWDDPAIECDSHVTINSFGCKFSITLLDNWIESYRKKNNITS